MPQLHRLALAHRRRHINSLINDDIGVVRLEGRPRQFQDIEPGAAISNT